MEKEREKLRKEKRKMDGRTPAMGSFSEQTGSGDTQGAFSQGGVDFCLGGVFLFSSVAELCGVVPFLRLEWLALSLSLRDSW